MIAFNVLSMEDLQ